MCIQNQVHKKNHTKSYDPDHTHICIYRQGNPFKNLFVLSLKGTKYYLSEIQEAIIKYQTMNKLFWIERCSTYHYSCIIHHIVYDYEFLLFCYYS